MRVLVVHDQYNGLGHGGEANVLGRERDLLRARGVETREITWQPHTPDASLATKAWALARGIYSRASYARVTAAIREFAPDVVHVHNFWPQATPAVHYAGRAAGCAVVQTIHNYLMLCVNGVLLRNQMPCDLCVDRLPWAAVRHRCLRDSFSRSAIAAAAFGAHRWIDTWNRTVDIFIAPNQSARERFVRSGIDPQRIVVKPQPAPDHGSGTSDRSYFLYAGRLGVEKGISTLLEAWKGCDSTLQIAGAGALEGLVRAAAERQPNIRYLGELLPADVAVAMQGAIATIVPSHWEEPFPLVIAESYAAAAPVIASDTGSRAETVNDGETGLIVPAGDVESLRRAVQWAAAHPTELRRMGNSARKRYETSYSEEAVGTRLMSIYEQARRAAGERGRSTR